MPTAIVRRVLATNEAIETGTASIMEGDDNITHDEDAILQGFPAKFECGATTHDIAAASMTMAVSPPTISGSRMEAAALSNPTVQQVRARVVTPEFDHRGTNRAGKQDKKKTHKKGSTPILDQEIIQVDSSDDDENEEQEESSHEIIMIDSDDDKENQNKEKRRPIAASKPRKLSYSTTATATARDRSKLPLTPRNTLRKMKRFTFDELDIDSEDSDDNGSFVEWLQSSTSRGKKRKSKKKSSQRRTLQDKPKPLALLSPTDKEEALSILTNPHDKALQTLLWKIGCRYTLLPHQFDAVRAVAGVPPNFLHNCTEPIDWGFKRSDDQDEHTAMMKQYEIALETVKLLPTRGILLADDMGLGKTVQGVAATILRNTISIAQRRKRRPTIIIGPNDAVLEQWEDTLLLAGVHPARVRFYSHDDDLVWNFRDCFMLMTRYTLMKEVRQMMQRESSTLFPGASKNLIRKFTNQYLAANGKKKNKFRRDRETEGDCITRLMRFQCKAIFCTVLIDEAHFLKNLVSYWGIGACLLGCHAERLVPLTGTPYNNGPQDMAALMTFIDPCHQAANKIWWEKATDGGRIQSVVDTVHKWREQYMIRREKSILHSRLPNKSIGAIHVSSYSSELEVYEFYEYVFLKTLEKFISVQTEDWSPDSKKKMLECFTIMMATMACMRMSLIHPVCPGGREMTIQFSPSRRHLLRVEAKQRENECVLCVKNPSQQSDLIKENRAKKQEKAAGNMKGTSNVQKNDPKKEKREKEPEIDDANIIGISNVRTADDDADMDDSDFDGREAGLKPSRHPLLGDLVVLDSDVCDAANGACPHYAHEKCLEFFHENPNSHCTRCDDLQRRISSGSSQSPMYCQHISVGPDIAGFKASPKIQKVIEWIKATPPDDKGIIYSFFKAGLDLLEGILIDELEIECARFDGDFCQAARAQDLDRFKRNPECRFLLATVQSGGVGLNIVEANHVCFMDRWFNPCVHEQAQDRCHRIKQKKEVHVSYFDVSMTVDEVMSRINTMKANNATIVLADGSALGAQHVGLNYSELSGVIGQMMRAIRIERRRKQEYEPGDRLTPMNIDELLQKIAGHANDKQRSNLKKEKKRLVASDGSHTENGVSGTDSFNSDDDVEDEDDDDSVVSHSKKENFSPIPNHTTATTMSDMDDEIPDSAFGKCKRENGTPDADWSDSSDDNSFFSHSKKKSHPHSPSHTSDTDNKVSGFAFGDLPERDDRMDADISHSSKKNSLPIPNPVITYVMSDDDDEMLDDSAFGTHALEQEKLKTYPSYTHDDETVLNQSDTGNRPTVPNDSDITILSDSNDDMFVKPVSNNTNIEKGTMELESVGIDNHDDTSTLDSSKVEERPSFETLPVYSGMSDSDEELPPSVFS